MVYGYFPADPRVKREVDALVHAGHELTVVSMQDAGESKFERLDGTVVHRVPLPVRRGGQARYAFQYLAFMVAVAAIVTWLHMTRNIRIFHIHSLPDFLVFAVALPRLTGAKIVLDLHEAMPEIMQARIGVGNRHPLIVLAAALERISCAFADRVLVVNDAIRALLESRGVRGSKLTVVMNSTDMVPPEAPPRDIIARFVPPGKRVIVYAGGLNPERDLETLLSALAIVRRHHDVRLLMYGSGDGSYTGRLRRRAVAERLGNDFVLGTWLPRHEVAAMLSLSELGPVTYEDNPLTQLAIPTKVFEYAAAGKPMVVASLRTIHEFLGDAAIYYRPGDAADLAKGIMALLEDPLKGEAIAAKARGIVAPYSWSLMMDRLLGVYGELGSVGR